MFFFYYFRRLQSPIKRSNFKRKIPTQNISFQLSANTYNKTLLNYTLYSLYGVLVAFLILAYFQYRYYIT